MTVGGGTEVEAQALIDLLDAGDTDDWKDPSVREMFRLVAHGFRQLLAERNEARARVARLEAEVKAWEHTAKFYDRMEAAMEDLAATGHTDTCEAMQPTRGCTCFVGIARTALEAKP